MSAPIKSTVAAEVTADYSVQKKEAVKAALHGHLIANVIHVVLSYLPVRMLPSLLSHHQFTVENDTLVSATFQRRNGKLQLNAATKNSEDFYIEDLEGVEPRREFPDPLGGVLKPDSKKQIYFHNDTYAVCDREWRLRYDHGRYWTCDRSFIFAEVLDSKALIGVTRSAIHQFPNFRSYDMMTATNYGINGAVHTAATMNPNQTLLFVSCFGSENSVLRTYSVPAITEVPSVTLVDWDVFLLSANHHEVASVAGNTRDPLRSCALWDIESSSKMLSFRPYAVQYARYELALSESLINIRIEVDPILRVDHYDIRTSITKPAAITKAPK